MQAWHLITGEYPPKLGGVSDYARLIAVELAGAGDEVHVWAPGTDGPLASDEGVITHPLPGRFGAAALAGLSRGLDAFPAPRRLLIQYVPQAYGFRAMNLAFAAWLLTRRGDERWLMFHEVAVQMAKGKRLKDNFLGAVTGVMAAMVARAADRIFVSALAWGPLIRRYFPDAPAVTWLPSPSNLPTASPTARSRLRASLRVTGPLVGHFGSFSGGVVPLLAPLVSEVLRRDPARRMLLLGRGGDAFARRHVPPELGARVIAPGVQAGEIVADHMSACDVMVQPYPDGISTRRSTAMAGLALGVPVASNLGALSETLWAEADAVALAPAPEPEQIADRVDELLRDRVRALEMAERGRALYDSSFSVEQTRRILRGEPAPVRLARRESGNRASC